MLQTIVIILVLLWLLGMVSSYTLGGVLHILLVVALILGDRAPRQWSVGGLTSAVSAVRSGGG